MMSYPKVTVIKESGPLTREAVTRWSLQGMEYGASSSEGSKGVTSVDWLEDHLTPVSLDMTNHLPCLCSTVCPLSVHTEYLMVVDIEENF